MPGSATTACLGIQEGFLEEVMPRWAETDRYKFSKQTKGTLWAEFKIKAPEVRGSTSSGGDSRSVGLTWLMAGLGQQAGQVG